MKIFKVFIILVITYSILTSSCCDPEAGNLRAGLNIISPESCVNAEGADCYNKVFVCKGDKVFLCWIGSGSKVTDVSGTSQILNQQNTEKNVPKINGKTGCITITAEESQVYTLKTSGAGKCNQIIQVQIIVIVEGNEEGILATHVDGDDLRWEIRYPKGQVSPNINVVSIRPECNPNKCFPGGFGNTPGYEYLPSCSPSCNGIWTVQMTDLNNNRNSFAVKNRKVDLPPKVSLVGTWSFFAPGESTSIPIQKQGNIWGQQNGGRFEEVGSAYFKAVLTCKQ